MRENELGFTPQGSIDTNKTTAPSSGVCWALRGCGCLPKYQRPVCGVLKLVVLPWTDVPPHYFFWTLRWTEQNKRACMRKKITKNGSSMAVSVCVWGQVTSIVGDRQCPVSSKTLARARATITGVHVTVAILVWQVHRNQWNVGLTFVSSPHI